MAGPRAHTAASLLEAGFQHGERAHFDRLAEATGEIWWGSRTVAGRRRLRRRADLLTAELASMDDPRVLELGCGTGALTRPLLECMPDLKLTAVDISPRSIDIARRQCADFSRARIEVVDLFESPYPPGSFDALIGNSVLHHLHVELFLPIITRLLRPGGLMWFYEPNMLNPQIAIEKNVGFIGRWLQNTPDETAFFRWRLGRQLRSAGFRDVSIVPFDFLHPGLPEWSAPLLDRLGKAVERFPLLREIAGSLRIRATRPDSV
jgi:SAM-dependent methyltransferase